MSARDRILGRVREALMERPHLTHPGPFEGARPPEAPGTTGDSIARFTELFEAAGGEVMRFDDHGDASEWVRGFIADFDGAAIGRLARWPTGFGADPASLSEGMDAADAGVGVSMAYGAVAETGSLIMTPQDGRRTQLLPPVHVVWVDASRVFPTLRQALNLLAGELPSAVGLHSGPSKSADIGQILVKGVHGPGRLIAVILGTETEEDS